jgi:hypothetical protein
MASREIQVINDTPGLYASLNRNKFFDMPSGDTTGENSHWLPFINDVKNDNINVKIKPIIGDEVLDCSKVESGSTRFNNTDKLFSSYVPNTDQSQDWSFSAEFSGESNGNKWIYFGSPYKSQLLRKKSRWTSATGIQFSERSQSSVGVVVLERAYLIYYSPGDKSMCYARVQYSENGETISDDYKRNYGYVSNDEINIIQRNKLLTVGCIMDINSRGNGYINLYDFKLLRSRQLKSKRSLLIVPAPHSIYSRINNRSVPIV